jgi:DNA-binding PadR family transcriptional regulator
MAAKIRRSDELLPLSPPVLYILLALADGESHGYAIMQDVERRTDSKVQLLPGSLYSTIKRMLAEDLIAERRPSRPRASDDERRRYYGITKYGRQVAAAELDRLATVLDYAKEKKVVPRPAPDITKR